MKLQQLNAAGDLKDLSIPSSNQLEALKGDRKGAYSIRINKQWRICFKWRHGHAFDVEFDPGRPAGDLLRSLVDAGEEIVRFERHVPSLHEIFVDHVRRHGDGRVEGGAGDA